ncbi:MAG: hypothetical protein JTJ18_08865 [Streptococcus sp.]|nr:hypothetical protein [Streptococcus sp.]
MKSITFNTIRTLLNEWADLRFACLPDFSLPFFSQGGWEGWIQVEWAMFFTSRDYDVVRELKAYDGHLLKADLVFNKNIPKANPSVMDIVVEIKCQSVYVTQNAFYQSISDDVAKLSMLGHNQRGIMVVVVFEQNLLNKLRSEGYYQIPLVQKNICIMYKAVR